MYRKLTAVVAGIGVGCLLSSCMGTSALLEETDYYCLNVDLDGYFTDSRGAGRGVKVPEGETLTPELASALCPTR